MSKLESAPLDALLALLRTFSLAYGWCLWRLISVPQRSIAVLHGVRTIALYVAVILAGTCHCRLFLFKQNEDSGRPGKTPSHAIGLGFFLLPFASARRSG